MSKEQIIRTWKDEENRSPLLLLWLGARQVLDSQMSLGTMLAMNTIAIAFLTPLASLVSNGRNWQPVGAHMERLADVWRPSRNKCRNWQLQCQMQKHPAAAFSYRE